MGEWGTAATCWRRPLFCRWFRPLFRTSSVSLPISSAANTVLKLCSASACLNSKVCDSDRHSLHLLTYALTHSSHGALALPVASKVIPVSLCSVASLSRGQGSVQEIRARSGLWHFHPYLTSGDGAQMRAQTGMICDM